MNNNTDIPEHVRLSLSRLQEERGKSGISRTELHKLSGVRENIIAAYEEGKGTPTKSKYNRLAEIFDWELWD